jgi:hypothetical protein
VASRNLTVNVNVADLPQVKAMFEKAKEEVDRLRAAVDAALELTNGDFCPIPDDAKNMRGRAGWRFAMDHIRAALAPVADPDPHTTSDEETT